MPYLAKEIFKEIFKGKTLEPGNYKVEVTVSTKNGNYTINKITSDATNDESENLININKILKIIASSSPTNVSSSSSTEPTNVSSVASSTTSTETPVLSSDTSSTETPVLSSDTSSTETPVLSSTASSNASSTVSSGGEKLTKLGGELDNLKQSLEQLMPSTNGTKGGNLTNHNQYSRKNNGHKRNTTLKH